MKLILGYMGYMGSCGLITVVAALVWLIYPERVIEINYVIHHLELLTNAVYGVVFMIAAIEWYLSDTWSYEGPAVTTVSK